MRSSPLLPIFLIVAVDVLGLTIMIPLLPFYAEKLGASPFVVGSLIGVYAFCQLISGPLLGRLSDRTGRRPLLLVSQVGTFIGFLVLAFSNSLWLVFLSRIIDGATAGNLSLAQAYIADVTAPEDRAKSFGVIGIAFGLGFLIGPAISGFLSKFGYQYPIFMAAGLSLTSIVATYFLLHEAPPAENQAEGAPTGRRLTVFAWREYLAYFRNPVLAPLLFQFWSYILAFAIFTSGFPLFAERRFTYNGQPVGPEQVGYFYAYAGFLGIILQGPLLGRMVKRFGEERIARTAFASAACGYVVLAFSYTVPVLYFAATLTAVGTLIRSTVTSRITKNTPNTEQGVVLGLTQSLTSVSQIIGPLLAGFLIQHGLLSPWALAAAAIAAIGLTLRTPPMSV
ncbi:MAG: MFS transporter [Bryobacteraceae bacterium]